MRGLESVLGLMWYTYNLISKINDFQLLKASANLVMYTLCCRSWFNKNFGLKFGFRWGSWGLSIFDGLVFSLSGGAACLRHEENSSNLLKADFKID